MRSNNSTTSKSRTRRTARLAAAAATAALAAGSIAALAPAAFASGTPGPSGQYNGVVVVTSTLTIQPAQSAFNLTAAPGQTTSTVPFEITLGSSDSAGYSLIESLSTPFGAIPDTSWTTDQWTITPSTGSGYTDTLTPYDAAGDAVTVFATTHVSGQTGNVGGHGPAPYATAAGQDVVTTDLHLTLPANYPGSPASGYAGQFVYQIVGS